MQAAHLAGGRRAVVASARPSRTTVVQVENRVAVRFQRYGRKHSPFYR